MHCNPRGAALLAAAMLLFAHASGFPQNPAKALKALKGKTLYLKTHEEAFGNPRISSWDWRRIYEFELSPAKDGASLLNGRPWEGQFFVTLKEFKVKEAKYKKKEGIAFLKLQATDVQLGNELQITIAPPEEAAALVDTLFFPSLGADADGYRRQAALTLTDLYIEPKFDVSQMSEQDRVELVAALQALSSAGTPSLDERDGQVFAAVGTFDTNVYNTVRVDSNKRISSTVSAAVKLAKLRLSNAPKSALEFLSGYRLFWDCYYRNFVSEKESSADRMELVVSREDFGEYADGNLSVFELIQKSILRVDGEKYTLTTFDPIG